LHSQTTARELSAFPYSNHHHVTILSLISFSSIASTDKITFEPSTDLLTAGHVFVTLFQVRALEHPGRGDVSTSSLTPPRLDIIRLYNIDYYRNATWKETWLEARLCAAQPSGHRHLRAGTQLSADVTITLRSGRIWIVHRTDIHRPHIVCKKCRRWRARQHARLVSMISRTCRTIENVAVS
jgi:hypothetical protein